MVAHTAELKDKNDDTVYPITIAGSVTDTDGVDLQTRVNTGVFVGAGTPATPTPYVDTADIVDGAITSDKVDLSVLTSTSSSITLTAGVWLVIHKVSVGQISISNPIVLIYSLTGFPNDTTVAGKCDTQNLWQTPCESAIVTLSSTTTLSRSNSTSSNAQTRDESWTAVRIK